jgi:hypothetical protein
VVEQLLTTADTTVGAAGALGLAGRSTSRWTPPEPVPAPQRLQKLAGQMTKRLRKYQAKA